MNHLTKAKVDSLLAYARRKGTKFELEAEPTYMIAMPQEVLYIFADVIASEILSAIHLTDADITRLCVKRYGLKADIDFHVGIVQDTLREQKQRLGDSL